MQKENKHESDVTLELISAIFLEGTPEYHRIKELADKDIAKELMGRIEKFLEHKDEPEIEEIKKIVFEDASKVSDANINDIVDSFVRIRSGGLDEVDKKSVNDILILFNEWISLGKGKQEQALPKDLFSVPVKERDMEKFNDLEEQIILFRQSGNEELYKSHSRSPVFSSMELYSGTESRLYNSDLGSEFICCPDHESLGYKSNSVYKNHGGKVNSS